MKNRKNSMKQIQKLKKKKAASKYQSLQRRLSNVSNMKPLPMNRGRLKWKYPALFLFSISFLILAVPTLVVLPFISSTEVLSQSIEHKQTPEQEEVLVDDSAVEVAVMRAQSEVVENVPLETYVMGVVASEMPIEFETEALKARGSGSKNLYCQ